SPYSGVLSKFCAAFLEGTEPVVYGDGEQTRDFTYIDNVVQATLLACEAAGASGRVCNVGTGERISLNQTLELLREISGTRLEAKYDPPREGDIRDSQADIRLAGELLGYLPAVNFSDGLRRTFDWYRESHVRALPKKKSPDCFSALFGLVVREHSFHCAWRSGSLSRFPLRCCGFPIAQRVAGFRLVVLVPKPQRLQLLLFRPKLI